MDNLDNIRKIIIESLHTEFIYFLKIIRYSFLSLYL